MTDVRDNAAESRFELATDGLTSWADYRRADGLLFIDHVEAPAPLRGTGAAARLMEGVAEAARAEGMKIVPICGYAAAWLRRHRQYSDLVA